MLANIFVALFANNDDVPPGSASQIVSVALQRPEASFLAFSRIVDLGDTCSFITLKKHTSYITQGAQRDSNLPILLTSKNLHF